MYSHFANADDNHSKSNIAILGNRLHFAVGFDLFQTQYKEQRYKFDNYTSFKNPIENSFSRVAWNLSYRVMQNYPLYIGMKTNRGINLSIKTGAYDTIGQQSVIVNTKSTADSIYIATPINPKILPFIIVTRLQTNSTILYENGKYFSTNNLGILYGTGITIPFKGKYTISFTYFLLNKYFNISRMFGVSVNYFLR